MNIYAPKGHKVVFLNKGGLTHHKEYALEKGLIEGNIYTVEKTDVDNFHTDVFLQEVESHGFNSVLFENYVES